MSSKILLRRGTAAQWSSANPILGIGELGIETDTLKIKIGNGTSTWTQLTSYANVTPAQLTSEINNLINAAPATLDTLNELAAAINNDASFLTTVTTSIATKAPIDSPTFTGTVTIPVGSAITGVPYLASANTFTENNTFASPIVAFVGTSGSYSSAAVSGYNIIHLSRGMILINSQTGGDYNLATNAYYNSGWKYFESAGSTLINFGGGRFDFGTASSGTAGNALTYTSKMTIANNGTVTINGFAAGSQGLIIKGAASQSANMQEWQNSAGTVLANIKSNGAFNIGVLQTGQFYTPTDTGPYLLSDQYGWSLINRSIVGTNIFTIKGMSGQTGNLQEWQNSSGTVLLRINSAGQIQAPQPASVGLVVKSATTLTATITNAVGSGTTVTYTAANAFTAGQTVSITGVTPVAYNLSLVTIATANATTFTVTNAAVGTYVSGGTATVIQTANLQQWQDGAGNTTSRVLNDGSFVWGTSSSVLQNSSGRLIVNPGTAASVGITVKGFASQTANLQEWQNSSGTTLAAIGPNGTVYMGSNNSANIATFYNGTSGYGAGAIAANGTFNINGANIGFPYTSSGAVVSVNATSATSVPLTARGYASQTADFQQWQNSSGTVLAKIDKDGQLFSTYSIYAGNATNYGGSINVLLQSGGKGVIVRNRASGTDDMQQWQDSSGTVLTKVDAYGNISTLNLYAGGYVGLGAAPSGATRVIISPTISSLIGLVVKGAASQSVNLTEWQNSAGTVLSRIDSTGALRVDTNTVLNNTQTGGTTAHIKVNYANTVPLIVQGAASQTANLQEWQDSAGTVLARIDANGQGAFKSTTLTASSAGGSAITLVAAASQTAPLLITAGGAQITAAGNYFKAPGIEATYVMNVTSGASTVVPFTVRGVASQTANLQEWQNSSGTVLSRIGFDGKARIGGSNGIGTGIVASTLGAGGIDPVWTVVTVKGAASQTADLQQWQNSAGTTLVKVQSDGAVGVNGTPGTNTKFYIEESYTGNSGANTALRARGTGSSASNWKGRIIAGGDTVAFLMGEYNSQAWLGGHNAALNAWASFYINPDGGQNLYLGNTGAAGSTPIVTIKNENGFVGIGTSSATAKLHIINTSASAEVLIVKGAASQTADLQQWQNSSGIVLAEITASGSLELNGKDIELMNIMGAF